METPLLLVNFKTYEKASGDEALDLAYKCEKAAKHTDKNVCIAVQNADISRIAEKVDIPVFAQHADPVDYGSNTGQDLIHTLKYNGADGVLINHSEDQEPLDRIEGIIERSSSEGLATMVCADDLSLAETIDSFNPDFVAYEPPELIGGSKSVSTQNPEKLKNIVSSLNSTVLAGAGIKTEEDVEAALKLGAEGILIASGVIKADNPYKALRKFLKPF